MQHWQCSGASPAISFYSRTNTKTWLPFGDSLGRLIPVDEAVNPVRTACCQRRAIHRTRSFPAFLTVDLAAWIAPLRWAVGRLGSPSRILLSYRFNVCSVKPAVYLPAIYLIVNTVMA